MRESDLTTELAAARDALAPADEVLARRAVERRVQKHQRQRIAVVLTVVFLVLGGAAVGLTRSGSDEQGVITTPKQQESLPRLVPTELPADWVLTRVITTPLTAEQLDEQFGGALPNRPTIVGLWTDGSMTQPDPTARTVVVLSQSVGTNEQSTADGARDGGSRTDPIDGTVISSAEGRFGGKWVSVVGRNFTADEVGAILEQVSVTPDGSMVAATVPESLLAVSPDATAGWVDWTSDDGTGYSLAAEGYGELFAKGSAAPQGSVVVQRVAESFLWTRMLFANGPIEVTTFDGHPAFYETHTSTSCSGSGSSSASGDTIADGTQGCETQVDATTLTWWPSPGVMVAVQAPTKEQALQVANSLVEVDESSWAAFVGSASGRSGDALPATSPGEAPSDGSMETTTSLRDDQSEGGPATTAPPAGASDPASSGDPATSTTVVLPPG